MKKDELVAEFKKRFNNDSPAVFFCPGRVNLIGEHIDYNGGKVMPCAISLGTYLLIAKNQTGKINLQSLNFPEKAELVPQHTYSKQGREWYYYPLGVIHELQQKGNTFKGLDLLFYGNLPVGAGLSSSASIEVLTSFALTQLFDLGIEPKDLALLSKKVENEFIGMNCGIMDQFAVAMGKADHAILLDCDTLEYDYLPFDTGAQTLAIINSNKPRKLTDSKYNERHQECRTALKQLQAKLSIENLCDLSPAEFEDHKSLVTDPTIQKRVLHVVTENDRVKEAAVALREGDIKHFGELMYASHRSLKEDYEVSGKELDTIVEFCSTYQNCNGARMTGAGFGGCAIALVHKDSFDEFAQELTKYYSDKIGYEPEVFASKIGSGTHAIK